MPPAFDDLAAMVLMTPDFLKKKHKRAEVGS